MASIKFFTHYAADPYYNMAFDEWMFARAHDDQTSIYLRLYSWMPGAITFGLHQDMHRAIDLSRLGATAAIRRITGGRALYHDESEITYAIAGCRTLFDRAGSTASVAATSRLIAGVLIDFLKRAGVDSELVRQSSHSGGGQDFFHKAPCFDSLARFEVTSAGAKIVASAQRVIDETVFQHGAIKIAGVASHPAIAPTGLEAEPGRRFNPLSQNTFHTLQVYFRQAFEQFFGCESIASQPDSAGQEELQKRILMVRKNYRVRRDIF